VKIKLNLIKQDDGLTIKGCIAVGRPDFDSFIKSCKKINNWYSQRPSFYTRH